MQDESKEITKLILCCCSDYQLIKKEHIQKLYAAAVDAGVEVELCADFCLETVQNHEKIKEISQSGMAVAACYPRGVKAFFQRVGVSAPKLIDIRHQPIESVFEELGWEMPPHFDPIDLPSYQNEWRAWFPLIDTERCTQCGKCVDYCFFGVYEKNEKKIHVANPKNCKTDCPACARMCPSQAIIFPKHTDDSICGKESSHDKVKVVNKFDENLYARLAERRRAQKKLNLLEE